MITAIVIITLSLLLACMAWRLAVLRIECDAAKLDAAQHKETEAAEEARGDALLEDKLALQEQLARAKANYEEAAQDVDAGNRKLELANLAHEALRAQLSARQRPARFQLEGGLSAEDIEEALAGTAALPIVRAIFAHIGTEIVRLSDAATDRPRETLVLPERIVQGYTAEERLHDAGGASHLAELLARLQELTKPRPQSQEQKAA